MVIQGGGERIIRQIYIWQLELYLPGQRHNLSLTPTESPNVKQVSELCLPHCRLNKWLDPLATVQQEDNLGILNRWRIWDRSFLQIFRSAFSTAVFSAVSECCFSEMPPGKVPDKRMLLLCWFIVIFIFLFTKRNITLLPGIQSCSSEHQKFYFSLPASAAENKKG